MRRSYLSLNSTYVNFETAKLLQRPQYRNQTAINRIGIKQKKSHFNEEVRLSIQMIRNLIAMLQLLVKHSLKIQGRLTPFLSIQDPFQLLFSNLLACQHRFSI